ncbi:ABC transporter permease [Corynebacterium ulceribovis]|uniref:ABC transporter permease n=1 Tax=Corynebacterium ulceribovis TaxID=487732 RepID=UPI00036E433B|nr:ABC transporter permease [Corynebacterium ulceribovis]
MASVGTQAMRKVSLRSLAAHKLRLFLTVLSVVLGTAFIAGSFIFTATLSAAFDDIVKTQFEGVDVVAEAGEQTPQGLAAADVEKISQVPGVKATRANQNSASVIIANSEGKAVQTSGAGGQGFYANPPGQEVGPDIEVLEGRMPEKDGEIAINKSAMENGNLKVGDKTKLVAGSSRMEATIVGQWDESIESTGGFIGVIFTKEEWTKLYTDGEHVDSLLVSVEPGTSPDDALTKLRAEFPQYKFETGQKLADDATKMIREMLSFVNYFLLAFGLIALIVGTFIISNTFSMIVAQRTKEFALLRALGASRGQLTASVVLEALLVGLIGSIVGIATGFGLVQLLQAVMRANGIDLPSKMSADWQSFVVPLVVGMLITVISAWAPAARAGRTHPVQAMRSGDTSNSASLLVRTIIGAVLLVIGAALAVTAAFNSDWSSTTRAQILGVGALLVILGLWLFAAWLSIPLASGLGRLIGWPFKAPGHLAATNSQRNPRRAAATAFALTLGLALVSSLGMLGATMKESVASQIDTGAKMDLVLQSAQQSFPIPNEAVEEVRNLDGVQSVVRENFTTAQVVPKEEAAETLKKMTANTSMAGRGGFNASTLDADPSVLFNIETVDGDLDLTKEGAGFLLPESLYQSSNMKIGEEYAVVTPMGMADAKLTGVFKDNNFYPGPLISEQLVDSISKDPRMKYTLMAYVFYDEGVNAGQQRSTIEDAVGEFLVVKVLTMDELKDASASQVNQMLAIIYGLLALAIIIAILGIINTLALSVIERRQEIGMLRAVGMQRGQVRIMIILESVQISIFGAIIGLLTGLGLGWCFVKILADDGLDKIVVPWDTLGTVLAASVLVGILAALWPAFKASRAKPLDAITDE